jgi:hypothetical protein
MTTDAVEFVVDTALLCGVTSLDLVTDCVETNNTWSEDGKSCD